MAVSKSYNRNQPWGTGISGAKGFFTNIEKPMSAWIFNHSGNQKKEDLIIPLAGLGQHLYNAVTCKNVYRIKPAFDRELSDAYLKTALDELENKRNNHALDSLEKALYYNPENFEARFFYARTLEKTGNQTEALAQFRLAKESKQFNSLQLKKQIFYKNPLYSDYSLQWQFEPSYAKTTPVSKFNFFGKILKLAHAACLFGILAFISPITSAAAFLPQTTETGTAILTAFVNDEDGETWGNNINAKLYIDEIAPGNMVAQGQTNENGLLVLNDIPTSLPENESRNTLAVYPNPFGNKANIQFEVKNQAAVNFNLYNLSGQKVWAAKYKAVIPGGQNKILDGENLPDGAYFLEMETQTKNSVTRQSATIIKQGGTQTGYTTGMNLTTKVAQIEATGRHILVLDGDFAKETVIEGIALPSGKNVELGTVEVEIASTIIKTKVVDENGDAWEGIAVEAYKGNQKIGEDQTGNQGQSEITIKTKKETNIELKVQEGNFNEGNQKSYTITQAGENNVSEITAGIKETTIKTTVLDENGDTWEGITVEAYKGNQKIGENNTGSQGQSEITIKTKEETNIELKVQEGNFNEGNQKSYTITQAGENNAGEITAGIKETIIKATVLDQFGNAYNAPNKGEVYSGDEKIGSGEINEGALEVPVYINKATSLETRIYGTDMQDTARIEKTINQAGSVELGDILINTPIIIKSGGNGFYDLDTKWLNDSTRQKPTGIAGMKVLVKTSDQNYETTTDAEGQFKLQIPMPENDTFETYIFNETDTTWYYWGRDDLVILAKENQVTAKNDTTGIPTWKQMYVEGSGHPESLRHEGMDFLEYMKGRLQLFYLWGDHAEEFVRIDDSKLPVTYCPDSSYIRTAIDSWDLRAPPNEEYPKAANLGLAALESGRLKFKKVDNLKDATIKFYYYGSLAGTTDIDMNLETFEYLGAVIKLRGPPYGEMISGEGGAYIIAHEGMQALTLSGDYSPYIEDNFYSSGIIRSSANPPQTLESHPREKKMIKTVYDLENFFRLNDYHKHNPVK